MKKTEVLSDRKIKAARCPNCGSAIKVSIFPVEHKPTMMEFQELENSGYVLSVEPFDPDKLNFNYCKCRPK